MGLISKSISVSLFFIFAAGSSYSAISLEEKFYTYSKQGFPYEKKLTREEKAFRVYQLIYPSIVETGYIDNNIYLEYYEPKGENKFPLILILPHLSGESLSIERFFAYCFVKNGFASLILETGLQKNWRKAKRWLKKEIKGEGISKIIPLFKQMAVEASRAIDIFGNNDKLDKEKIGIMGISFGAIVAPIVAGIDTRVKGSVYILGGGDILKIIRKSRLARKFREYIEKENIEEIKKKLELIDPLTFAHLAKSKPTLMINAYFDRDIPRTSTLELWKALDKPRIIWLPTSHYLAIFFIGYARLQALRHFQNLFYEKRMAEEKVIYFASTAVEPFRLKMHNLFGHKEKLSVSGKISERENRIRIGIEKSLGDEDYFLGTEINVRSWDDERFSLKGKGFDFYFGENIIEAFKVYLKYHFEDIDIYHLSSGLISDFENYKGNNQIASFSLNFDYAVLDEAKYPKEGTHNSLSLEMSGKSLGSKANFLRILGESSWYFTPFEFFTFVLRFKGGWMDDFGSSSDVPFFERFYAGGSGSIRGYRSRYVGPRDNQDLPLGGEVIFLTNFELRFPIYKKLYGAGFFDIGNVWKNNDFKWGGFKSGTGFGLRYKLTIGVARLDYGFGLDPDTRRENGALTLTLGLPF
ncbi:MAG: BamA/TamA family outer membrane protein [Candidatus Omnitrophica bacterium]|nr:BamA/TamA family outer membrane protein [Candidatus Omnitrophota bacterium]